MLHSNYLELFLKVAEFGSFSKAADASFVTPSAVIKQINLLEADIGVRLFDRTHRGIKLSKAGESLKADAKEIIKKSNEAIDKAKMAMLEDADIIRIGTSPITPPEVLIELWPKLSSIMTGYKFQLIQFENTPENAKMILKNLGENIDVVAGIFDEKLLLYRECAGIELSKEKLCVSFSINHPLACKEKISIDDLHGYELMMLKEGSMKIMDDLREFISKNHPQVKIVDFPLYNLSVFNECENKDKMLITIKRWDTAHPFLKTVDMDWKYAMPYGILHSKTPDKKVKYFIDCIKSVI